MDEIAVKHLKTYQVWHHRRLLLTAVRKPAPELQFIARSLRVDSKNYHTWSYRQWLLAYFDDEDLWEGELDFVDAMLNDDLRNNSAWHHRFFVVWQSGLREGEKDRDRVCRREFTYGFSPLTHLLSFSDFALSFRRFVKQQISLAPNNPSAWNYLRGILDHNKLPYSLLCDFVQPYAKAHASQSTADLVDLENPAPAPGAELPCPAAIEFLADILEKEGGDSIQKATEVRVRSCSTV